MTSRYRTGDLLAAAESTHGRTNLFNMSNVELTGAGGTAEPVYRVNKGQTIKVELTYENLGKTSPLTAKIDFYLSTNDPFSTTDRFLVEGAVTLHFVSWLSQYDLECLVYHASRLGSVDKIIGSMPLLITTMSMRTQ